MPSRRDRIERAAREVLGFERLRPGQAEAAESVLAGRDTLAVLSTGSGKSAIYQLAGLLSKGATLVVSPLIALQLDQVDALRERALGAAQLNSSVPEGERADALAELAEDSLEFLFLAPEQLGNAEVLDELAAGAPSLIVVDEAHCISEWGHDFRPDYLRLGAAIETLGHPPVLALTATAAPPVRDEIVERLGLREPAIVVRGFDRPNIDLAVERFHDERHKDEALLDAVEAADKPGIVYAATRKRTEQIAAALAERGVETCAYHAGLKASDREAAQERFMDGGLEAIVATTAFGMGVDKADVRFVFHAEIPESVDSYYQEVGRAGRDGEPARAVLFYRPEDLGLRRFFAGTGRVGADELRDVAEAVADARDPIAPTDLQERTELSQTKLATAVSRLEDAGAVEVLPTGHVVRPPSAPPVEEAVDEALETEEDRREFERSRLEMIRGFAETGGCRREFVLSYFGEPFEAPCGRCDNCRAGRVQEDNDADEPFTVGARVAHREWGEGVVQRYDRDRAVVVLFDDVGYKTLALDVVVRRGLLEPA
ncbi:MAG TPA: ATP-dependent DNA helicase RecQ [Solirubrobacteraceae bacterium]|nr:ATP-dependent DNA helicase RecQ [Solirubrobacteraceae bacterium]